MTEGEELYSKDYEKLLALTTLVKKICKRFFNKTGINHFSYIEWEHNGRMLWLDSCDVYLKDCFENHIAHSFVDNIHDFYPISGTYLLDIYPPARDKNRAFIDFLAQYDYCHPCHFYTKSATPDRRNKLFCYEAPLASEHINHLYINEMGYLKKFNEYFLNKILDLKIHAFFSHAEPDLNALTKMNESFPDEPADLPKITAREREVMFWYVQGKTSKEIAEMLKLSQRTIERHFENLRDKFDCDSKSQIAIRLLKLGVDLSEFYY